MLNQSDRIDHYRLPFEWVKAALGETVTIAMSAQFSTERLECNRYSVESPHLGQIDIPRLSQALQLPTAAVAVVNEKLLTQPYQLYFVGASEQGETLAYRLYFGYVKPEMVSSETSVFYAIDWVPAREDFILREYHHRDTLSPSRAQELVRESLASSEGKTIIDVITPLLGKSQSYDAYIVREEESLRRSVDLGLYEANLVFSDIADKLRVLAGMFAISESNYSDWYRLVSGEQIGRMAVGTNRRGLPFVTLYGRYVHKEPRYYIPDSTPALPDALVSGARQALTKRSLLQGGVGPSTCSECSKESADDDRSGPAKVYVLGTIGYDFISDARHDSLAQAMGVKEAGQVSAFLRHLESHPHIAASVIWTVELDSTPIYAVIPTGPYATSIYDRLIAILRAQEAGMINRVSIPGIASVSSIRTRSGQALTALFPELIGMYGWTTEGLVTSVCGPRPKEDGCNDRHEEKKSYDKKAQRVHQFLERVYYELRNLGITPQDRALNFAATNAHQVEQIYVRALSESLELDKIDVVKSPVARPGSDSWDVKMTFFQPKQRLERAKVEYRFTVDVTDVIPLIRGPVREWSVY